MTEYDDAEAGATIYATPITHYIDGRAEARLVLRPAAIALTGPGPDLTDAFIAGLLEAGFDLLLDADQTPNTTDVFTATLTTRPERSSLDHHLVIADRGGVALFDGALPASSATTNPKTGTRDTWIDIAATTGHLAVTIATPPTDPTFESDIDVETDTLGWLSTAVRAGHAVGATIPITIRERR